MFILLGNDPGDEDVDIGGNGPPISSYPPVEIEKDTGLKGTKCVSSSSSSGKLHFLLVFYVILQDQLNVTKQNFK